MFQQRSLNAGTCAYYSQTTVEPLQWQKSNGGLYIILSGLFVLSVSLEVSTVEGCQQQSINNETVATAVYHVARLGAMCELYESYIIFEQNLLLLTRGAHTAFITLV